MKKLNPYLYYQLASSLIGLRGLPDSGGTVAEMFFPLYHARNALAPFLEGDGGLHSTSKRAAAAIQAVISDMAVEKRGEMFAIVDKAVAPAKVKALKKALADFEIVLANETPDLNVYLVANKGIYSTAALVENADDAIRAGLSIEAQRMIPETVYRDFKEAGRCLAFEVPTAAGFHVARSVESAIQAYWALIMCKPIDEAPRLASCIDQLRKSKESPKIIDVIDHFRDLHRNTLMHPQEFLEIGDALRLFDIAKSAIAAVASRMNEASLIASAP